jgi:mannose-1-phosphate guanylyltransferase
MRTAIVINAGGTGTRLWPLSTKELPKQFVSLINEKSLIRNTFERVAEQYDTKDIFVTTSVKFKDEIRKQLPEIPDENIILEAKKMDTGPAIGLMTFKMKERGYETVISIACDHNIEDVPEFLRILKVAEDVNQKYVDKMLLIGMSPNYAATGFGYIEMGAPVDRVDKDIIFSVESFIEKPERKRAEKLLADWKYLWNASYFIFNPDFLLSQYKKFSKETYELLEKAFKLDPLSKEFIALYSKTEAIAFEYMILEKLKDILVLPASVGWSDIGSWKAVKEILTDYDDDENVYSANVVDIDTKGCVIYSTDKKKTVAVLGLKNVVVLNTEDVLLVTTVDKSEDVKKLVEKVEDDLK